MTYRQKSPAGIDDEKHEQHFPSEDEFQIWISEVFLHLFV